MAPRSTLKEGLSICTYERTRSHDQDESISKVETQSRLQFKVLFCHEAVMAILARPKVSKNFERMRRFYDIY